MTEICVYYIYVPPSTLIFEKFKGGRGMPPLNLPVSIIRTLLFLIIGLMFYFWSLDFMFYTHVTISDHWTPCFIRTLLFLKIGLHVLFLIIGLHVLFPGASLRDGSDRVLWERASLAEIDINLAMLRHRSLNRKVNPQSWTHD